MKRSFVTILVAASVFAIGACAGEDDDVNIEPVEEVGPPPAPAPAPPPPPPVDTTTPADTTAGDTATTTTRL